MGEKETFPNLQTPDRLLERGNRPQCAPKRPRLCLGSKWNRGESVPGRSSSWYKKSSRRSKDSGRLFWTIATQHRGEIELTDFSHFPIWRKERLILIVWSRVLKVQCFCSFLSRHKVFRFSWMSLDQDINHSNLSSFHVIAVGPSKFQGKTCSLFALF